MSTSRIAVSEANLPAGRIHSDRAPPILALVLLLGCEDLREPYIVLTVRAEGDREIVADELAIGRKLGELREVRRVTSRFPVTLALTGPDSEEATVWVEARARDQVLGRGSTKVFFDRANPGTGTVVLGTPCEDASVCDDGVFCNGAEVCLNRVCAAGPVPCPEAALACGVRVACIESTLSCDLLSDPAYDDKNPCTRDACGPDQRPLHVADATADGNACDSDTVSSGVCAAGACVPTTCGDGIVDSRDEECDDVDSSCVGCRLVIRRVKKGSAQADRGSGAPVISGDGSSVFFSSKAGNLVAGDTNGTDDVFVWKLSDNELRIVSEGLAGAPANGASGTGGRIAVSSDGRIVAFSSLAANLVPGDLNEAEDVFVVVDGVATLVSSAPDSAPSNGASFSPSVSLDGRFVAFASSASNLVDDDVNGVADVFVRDRAAGTTIRALGAEGAEPNGPSDHPAISADGRYLVFGSAASNLVSGDENGVADVFLFDLTTGDTTRVSVTSTRAEANGPSGEPVISSDGSGIVFVSSATNLVPGVVEGTQQIFFRPRSEATVSLISRTREGNAANSDCFDPSISGDRFVAFASAATNLDGLSRAHADVFLFDRTSADLRLVSALPGMSPANGASGRPAVSPDGALVAFESDASNLVENDTNLVRDVFIRRVTLP
ncbi:MAG: PD40 domain-containing protein [Deltaproteobacteria bacterium]|nr:PD40 domain-containing protein [Deltaproteobacteria bacterium]